MGPAETQLKFRLPPDLKPRLEAAARANKRSLNMEVIARLERSFEDEAERSRVAAAKLARKTPGADPLEARLADLEKRVRKLEGKGKKR